MGLRSHTARSIDQQHGNVAVRGSHRHVTRVLLVARRVGDRNPPTIGQIQMPVRDVNGDSLFTLGFEPVR